jgi:hypothetical protein
MNNDTAYKHLPGQANLKLRQLYKSLIAHHSKAKCALCDSYPQYGCTIVKGDIYQHIADIAQRSVHAKEVHKLQEVGLIGIEQITPQQHRIVFKLREEQLV